MRSKRTQQLRPPAPTKAARGRGKGGDSGSAPRIAGSATSPGKDGKRRACEGADKGSQSAGDWSVNGRSFVGWGGNRAPKLRARTTTSGRRRAIVALRDAGPALLRVPSGVLARDVTTRFGIRYSTAYRAVEYVKHHPVRVAL